MMYNLTFARAFEAMVRGAVVENESVPGGRYKASEYQSPNGPKLLYRHKTENRWRAARFLPCEILHAKWRVVKMKKRVR